MKPLLENLVQSELQKKDPSEFPRRNGRERLSFAPFYFRAGMCSASTHVSSGL